MGHTYEFDKFFLDDEKHLLLGPNGRVDLEPIQFKVLLKLLEDAPDVVTRAKFRELWTENLTVGRSLDQTIYMLRLKLGDRNTGAKGGKKEYRFIRAIPKIGYEFVAPVNVDAPLAPSSTPLPTPASGVPRTISLSRKKTNPHGADVGFLITPPAPWRLTCKMVSSSSYFRFGFKTFPRGEKIFRGSALHSEGRNLVVHVGRNYWDQEGISKKDLFVRATYINGLELYEDTRIKRRVPQTARAKIGLALTEAFELKLFVDDICCFRHVVPPDLCYHVAVLGWGDKEDYNVDLSQISVEIGQAVSK